MKKHVLEHFKRVDLRLHSVALKVGRVTLSSSTQHFIELCDSIISQQLSVKAGAIQKMYGLRNEPSPKKLQSLSKKWAPYRSYASLILWESLELD